ncbi:MAG TPA: amidohydrolase family protein, partial [Gammaproteobacteria bacterium]
MKLVRTTLAALALSLPIAACQPDAEVPAPASRPAGLPPADLVLTNSKILTVDEDFSIVEAIAIDGERILDVGTAAAIAQHIGENTEVIDLEGRAVIPGLIDNHMHFIRAVQRWDLQARIDGVNIRQEALDIIAEKAASMQPGEWLMVQGGWRENQFADVRGGFTLEELDAAAPNNPLFLQITYQAVYANSLALEAVGVSPEEGAAHRGPPLISGEPPYGLLNEQMPAASGEQLEINMLDFARELNRSGLTSVYDVGRPPEGDIALVQEMNEREPLPIRVWHTLKYQAYDPEGA